MQKEITFEQLSQGTTTVIRSSREYRAIGIVNWLSPRLGEIFDESSVRNMISEGVKVTILLPTK